MPTPYIGQLKPAVGGGLGGMPARQTVAAASSALPTYVYSIVNPSLDLGSQRFEYVGGKVYMAYLDANAPACMRVTCFDTAGNYVYQKKFQVATACSNVRLRVAPDGTAYAAVSDPTNAYGHLIKIAPDGTVSWMQRITTTTKYIRCMDIGADGYLYILYLYSGGSSTGIMKVDVSGASPSVVWTYVVGSGSVPQRIKVNADGSMYVTTGDGGTTSYIFKISSAPAIVWARNIAGGWTTRFLWDAAEDGLGNVWFVGHANDGTNNFPIVCKHSASTGVASLQMRVSAPYDYGYPQQISLGPDGKMVGSIYGVGLGVSGASVNAVQSGYGRFKFDPAPSAPPFPFTVDILVQAGSSGSTAEAVSGKIGSDYVAIGSQTSTTQTFVALMPVASPPTRGTYTYNGSAYTAAGILSSRTSTLVSAGGGLGDTSNGSGISSTAESFTNSTSSFTVSNGSDVLAVATLTGY